MSGCIKTAPATRREAAVMSEKGRETSGMQRTGVDEKWCVKSRKPSAGAQSRTKGGPFEGGGQWVRQCWSSWE